MPPDEKQLAYVSAFKEPHAFYVAGEDNLRISAVNAKSDGVVIQINGRMIGLDGRVQPFTARLVPASDRTETTTIIPIGEGWITNITAVNVAGTAIFGQTWVRIDVVRGLGGAVEPLATLAAGLITRTIKLTFPGGGNYAPLEFPGAMRAVTGTDPAAGSEMIEAVPTGARWRVHALTAALTTDATVATREVVAIIDDGANIMFRATPNTSHAASLTRLYTFSTTGYINAAAAAIVSNPLPPQLMMIAGWRIRTATALIQAGDDWAAPRLIVEEWLEVS